MPPVSKNPLILLLVFAIMGGLLGLVIVPWMVRLDLLDPWLATATRINATIWVIVLGWSLHHLVFQLAALVVPRRPLAAPATSSARMPLVVLYLACDDFQEEPCRTCLDQDYPADCFRVIIGDDSQSEAGRQAVDRFQQAHPQVTVLRRDDRRGFKAGNINHALRQLRDDEAWVIVVDADQLLPRDYVRRMAEALAQAPADVAFVQAGHEPEGLRPRPAPIVETAETSFPDALGLEVQVFYERDLPLRERFGFLPFLGHGAALRRSVWTALGGMPEVVSEDYAYALTACAGGWRGRHVPGLFSWEAFPKDFGAFLVRFGKFAAGSAELLKHGSLWTFLRSSRVTLVEKLDLCGLLLWYPLMPLVLLNLYLSGYVCHRLWELEIAFLHPLLPYFFVAMFLLIWPVLHSVTASPWRSLRFWFWASAIYAAAMPLAAWRFITHLFRPARFEPTPKGSHRSRTFGGASVALIVLGAATLALAWRWLSPFSPVLAAYGVAFVSFPLYHLLNHSTWLGLLSRWVVCAPGVGLVAGLVAMWLWGKF